MTSIFNKIENIVSEIQKKDNSIQTLPISSMDKFEFKFITFLFIARYELKINSIISDTTASILTNLITFQTFEYYKGIYPSLYNDCRELRNMLSFYNDNINNYDLPNIDISSEKKWVDYFHKAVKKLLI
jgi:hypothetical protein